MLEKRLGLRACIISSIVDSGRTAHYTYDALARLSTAQTNGSTPYPQWGLSETYDRYGNRTAQTVTAGTGPSNSVSVSSTTNRLTGSPYTYDSNGNMTNDGSNTLVYDAENHVTSINSAANEYLYDGNGLRVKKCAPNCTSPTSRTVYIFSGSKVIAEYDNGAAYNSPTREYLYAGGSLLARIDGSTTKYYHQDHLSNRLTTDSSGTALEQKGHFPFGEDWYQGSDKLKFTTYERDSESGNDFAMARSYVNRLGRFASPDPLAGSIGDPQSLNRFAYVRNDPINSTDPLGLFMLAHPLHFMFPEGGDWDDGGDPNINDESRQKAPGGAGGDGPAVAAVQAAAAKLATAIQSGIFENDLCVSDLAALDIMSPYDLLTDVYSAQYVDGTGSTIPLWILSANSVLGDHANAANLPGTVGSELAKPGVVAVAQAAGHAVFLNPLRIDPGNSDWNLGMAFHETLHNATKFTDPDIQRRLGLPEARASHNIDVKIMKDCLGIIIL